LTIYIPTVILGTNSDMAIEQSSFEKDLTVSIQLDMTKALVEVQDTPRLLLMVVEKELNEIELIEPQLESYAIALSRLNQGIEAVESAAEVLGINHPSLPLAEGIFHDDFTRGWAQLLEERSEVSTRLLEMQSHTAQKQILQAVQVILEYQGGQLSSMLEIWQSDHPEELIAIANSINKNLSPKDESDRFKLIKTDVLDILQGGPQVKLHLRSELLKRKHRPEDIDVALRQILEENGKIEMGWCTNAARVASNLNHGAGMLIKSPHHPIPDTVIFYKGMTRDEVVEMHLRELLNLIAGFKEPLMTRDITALYNKSAAYPLNVQRMGTFLWELAHMEKIKKGWGNTGRGRGIVYGPINEESELNSQEEVGFEDLPEPFGPID
jgi:hypothetical protein